MAAASDLHARRKHAAGANTRVFPNLDILRDDRMLSQRHSERQPSGGMDYSRPVHASLPRIVIVVAQEARDPGESEFGMITNQERLGRGVREYELACDHRTSAGLQCGRQMFPV